MPPRWTRLEPEEFLGCEPWPLRKFRLDWALDSLKRRFIDTSVRLVSTYLGKSLQKYASGVWAHIYQEKDVPFFTKKQEKRLKNPLRGVL